MFLAVNLRLDADGLALLNIALILVSAGFLIGLRREASLEVAALVYLGVLFVNMFATLARPDVHPGTPSSMAMIPVLAYLLLPVRLALPVTVAALLAAAAAYFAGVDVAPYRMEPLLIAHVMTPIVGLFVVCHFYSRVRTQSVRQMLERVFRDPLTGLWNREKLTAELEREQQRVRRTGTSLSLILIDLDDFKKLNDRYGHDAGDTALAFFARLLIQRLRRIDVPCRIGGEEFAVLLPETTVAGAVTVAEELRAILEGSVISHGEHAINMTMSAGVVEYGRDGGDWQQLYCIADALLYECKARGRNCVLGSDSAWSLSSERLQA